MGWKSKMLHPLVVTNEVTIPNFHQMKKLACLALIIFTALTIGACTNDEGEGDLDFLIPEETEQTQLTKSS